MTATREHEIGREGQRPSTTGDGQLFVLHRLAQHLHQAGAKLGQFVQEEHAPVRQVMSDDTSSLVPAVEMVAYV